MRARLSAVQQALVLLPLASVACAVLVRPHPENKRFMAALEEVSRFNASFQRDALEQTMRNAAQAQGAIPLTALQAAASKKRAPNVEVTDAAASLRPLTLVSLATLSELNAHAQATSTLTIGTPDAEALGAALAWRLADLDKPGPFVLADAQLVAAPVTQSDVDLEREVPQLRTTRGQAQAAVKEATERVDMEDRVFEARKKRHLPWKVLVKSVEARKEARGVLDEKTSALNAAERAYHDAVAQAQKPRTASDPRAVPEFAAANVTLLNGSEKITLQIPVALTRTAVPVPAVAQASFPATHQAELWEEVQALAPAAAVDSIRGHFNWHYHYIEVLGFKLGGMTLLQLLPCLLPLLLWFLLTRIRAASSSYSPFTTEVRGALPHVGFRNRSLEGLALVLLPCLAGISAAAALMLVGQVPVLPVIATVACLLLGLEAFGKLGDLQELVASVVHSHSYPPAPAPAAHAEE